MIISWLTFLAAFVNIEKLTRGQPVCVEVQRPSRGRGGLVVDTLDYGSRDRKVQASLGSLVSLSKTYLPDKKYW